MFITMKIHYEVTEMENRAYYAVIPANVRYCKDLSANMKLMYGEITALSNEKGYCWASNSYFAELYDVDRCTVSRWISKLEKLGFIRTEVIYTESKKKQIKERRIYIGGIQFVDVDIPDADVPMGIKNQSTPIDEKINTPRQKRQHPIDEKINTPIDEKIKENNKDFNNINNNIEHPKDAPLSKVKKRDRIDAFFEKVWALYPNKKGKSAVTKKSKEALYKMGLEHISKIIDRYKAEIEKQRSRGFDLQYQHGSTFFNGRYLDYAEEEHAEEEFVMSEESKRLLAEMLK